MKGTGSRILRSSDRTRGNINGRREDKKCIGLADSKRS